MTTDVPATVEQAASAGHSGTKADLGCPGNAAAETFAAAGHTDTTPGLDYRSAATDEAADGCHTAAAYFRSGFVLTGTVADRTRIPVD